MTSRKVKIESRNEQFTSKIKSEITLEVPADDNEFLSKEMRTHGYDVLELMERCDHLDSLYLTFTGELPNKAQKKLLNSLAIFLMNLGPRHASSRAAANAGIGRTDVNHILPIGIMAMGGAYGGSKEVEMAMRFIKKHYANDAANVATQQLAQVKDPSIGDWLVAPGFGTDYRGQSPFLLAAKSKLLALAPQSGYLAWCQDFTQALPEKEHCGWRLAGLVAGTLLDLNIPPRAGAGLFQLLASPGALAHGLQFANKPLTDIPFLKDEDYEITS
ncbi:citrate synthase [Litorilituus sediminis]|uniref:Citrate synthase n=1 Tax=Litorilituus sediminis TaxID=718192 RepID=A0A4P6PBW9_9GAMM|nr:citrate synthase [Litorilituus sediminis]QBG37212.1 citrate synthase [Litorilituus sediminis]